MAEHEAVEVDPQELRKAQELWGNFAIGVKYVSVATAVVLILMALAFVKF